MASDVIPAWLEWSELERAAYYYIRITSQMAQLKNPVVVSYERLVDDPSRTVSRLAQDLGLEWGELTDSLVSQVSLRSSLSEDWVARLEPSLQKQVLASELISLG